MAYSPNVDYRAEARKAAAAEGLNPGIFERQIGVESINYSPAVISGKQRSPAGAVGIAQFMPPTAAGLGVDPLHPVQALRGAAKLMASYVRKYGNYTDALVAYNAGPGRVGGQLPSETQNYVKEILRGHDPGRLSRPQQIQAGPGAGSGGGGAQTAAGGVSAPNLGQGSTLTAALAAALQASSRPAPTVTAPALPAFAAAPKMAGPAIAPAAAPAGGQGPDMKTLLSAVLAGGDTSQTPGGVPQAGAGGAAPGAAPAGGRLGRTLVVGDSLGVGTLPVLQRLLGGRVTGDVKVGRASPEGVAVLKRELASGNYQNVVFDQGTNDSSAAELRKSLAQVRRLAPNARILIPTLNGPFATAAKNQVLHAFAKSDPNVKLVPWHSLSQNGLLGPDSTHATPAGYAQRGRLIAKELGWSPAAAQAAPGGGQVKLGPGANRAGVNVQPVVKSFLDAVSGVLGRPVVVSTGTNHNQFVAGRPGVQSDHWTGNAADLGDAANGFSYGGKGGDRLAAAALVAAGVPRARAVAMAAKGSGVVPGGVWNITPSSGPWKGRRVQIIWKSMAGGNHFNHVHVGVR